MEKQRRITDSKDSEIRSEGEDKKFFRGYASVFNFRTDLGYFYESIHPEAFNNSLARQDDVRALFNHDTNLLLARTSSGTLKLSVDDVGLLSEIDIPDTTLGRDLTVLTDRKDITQMSFGFYIDRDEQRGTIDGKPWFEIMDVTLFDVSPVTFPAYEQTTFEVQRSIELRARDLKIQVDSAKIRHKVRNRQIGLLKY